MKRMVLLVVIALLMTAMVAVTATAAVALGPCDHPGPKEATSCFWYNYGTSHH